MSVRFGSVEIDLVAISKLQTLGLQSNRNLVGDLVSMFETETPQLIQELKRHLSSCEFVAVGKIAHHLKSSCANLGVIRMRDLAIRMEEAAPEKDAQVMQSLLSSIEKDFVLASQELKKYQAP